MTRLKILGRIGGWCIASYMASFLLWSLLCCSFSAGCQNAYAALTFPAIYFTKDSSRFVEGNSVAHPILLTILLAGLISALACPNARKARILLYGAMLLYSAFYGVLVPLAHSV